MQEQYKAKAPNVCKYLRFYGEDTDGNFHFAHHKDLIIRSIPLSKFDSEYHLCSFAPYEAWLKDFETLKIAKDGAAIQTGKPDWKKAGHWLLEACRASNGNAMYNKSKLAGTGAWLDKGQFLVHTGESLLIPDGKDEKVQKELDQQKGEYIYIRQHGIPLVKLSPLSVQEAATIKDFLNCFDFESDLHRAVVAGWLAVAPICGALDWRVHVWLEGLAGRGKSTLLAGMRKILAVFHLWCDSKQTSEAGIRTDIDSRAIPVLYDEAEKIRHEVLELIRSASTGGQIKKSNSQQKVVVYRVQSSFFLVSTQETLVTDADKTRFIIVRLTALSEKTATELQARDKLQLQIAEDFTPEFSSQFFMRSVQQYHNITTSIEKLKEVLIQETSIVKPREAKTYATILAGYWSLESDHAITKEEAINMLNRFEFNKALETIEEEVDNLPSHERAFCHLLHSIIKVQGERGMREMAVGEALEKVCRHYAGSQLHADYDITDLENALLRYGIAYRPDKNNGLWIQNSNQNLAKLLDDHGCAGKWNNLFRSLSPDCKSITQNVFGTSPRGNLIPNYPKLIDKLGQYAKPKCQDNEQDSLLEF